MIRPLIIVLTEHYSILKVSADYEKLTNAQRVGAQFT